METAATEETKMCSTCNRPIEMSKIRMHEIGCARMNYRCAECGDVVAKSEKEEHEKDAHVKLKCQYCSFEAIKTKFGEHEEKCDMKPKPCRYCE